jgi:hypothetical protein
MPAQKTRMYTSIKSAISNLTPKFAKARQSGALYFFESEVKDVEQDERRVRLVWSSFYHVPCLTSCLASFKSASVPR